jgi:hypothetical protein
VIQHKLVLLGIVNLVIGIVNLVIVLIERAFPVVKIVINQHHALSVLIPKAILTIASWVIP